MLGPVLPAASRPRKSRSGYRCTVHRQRGEAATAVDELGNSNRELSGAAYGIDLRPFQYIARKIAPFLP